MTDGDLPPITHFRLSAIDAVRKRIATDEELESLTGGPLDADGFDQLARRLKELLPAGVRSKALRESLLHLAGEPITMPLLDKLGWRLAGNIDRLKAGSPVLPWRVQLRNEWVPLLITDYVPDRNYRGDAGATFTFQILAGTPCGLSTERFWSNRLCSYLAGKIGFTPPWKQHPFRRAQELVGFRLYGLIDAEKSLQHPVFEQTSAVETMRKANRELLKRRQREGFVCPKDYKHECLVCPVGTDQCPCATHARTFVAQICEVCEKNAWTDPRHVDLRLCFNCFVNRQMTRKK